MRGVAKSFEGTEFGTFEAGVSSVDYQKKESHRKKIIGFVSLAFSKKHARDNFDLYLLIDLEKGFVEATPQSVYVEGRYNKFSREIAQTFHYCFKCRGRGCRFCNYTGKLSEHSVQELLENFFLPAFEAKESRFHGAGREDVDVLMLGEGRPFVLELVEPKKRSVELRGLENKINAECKDLIAVHGLSYSSKQKIAELKNTDFKKTYSAKCGCTQPLSDGDISALVGKELEVVQVTPERVEKRRPIRERNKTAQILKAELIDAQHFHLEILASHGLYIKEFVSGDNGRTKPSVSSLLGKECMCVELDVLEIIMV